MTKKLKWLSIPIVAVLAATLLVLMLPTVPAEMIKRGVSGHENIKEEVV